MKKLKMFLLLLPLAGLAFAAASDDAAGRQSKPDFSGTWKLDMSLSDFGGPTNDLVYDDLILIISHREPELKITRKIFRKRRERSQELLYFSDARGESNPPLDGKETIKSKTGWEGNALISKGLTRIVMPGARLTIEWTDKWELSSNGNTLIHTTVSNLVGGSDRTVISPSNLPRAIRRVFRKMS